MELDAQTLAAGSSVRCPNCGESIQLDVDSTGLSSIVGPPGDNTMNPRPGADSSLTGSSYALSDLADSDVSSEPASTDNPPDATLEASPRASSLAGDEDLTPPDIEATMVFGGRQEDDDDDEPFLLGDDEEIDEGDAGEFSDIDAVGGESLDATIDFGQLANKGRPTDFDLGGPGSEATIDHAGKPSPERPRLDLDGPDSGDDLTVMHGMPGLAGSPPVLSDRPSRPGDDATLAADSGEADSGNVGSDRSDSDSGGSGLAGDVTESPSTHPGGGLSDRDSATLAFDSERRSDHVGTPEPREITGLDSGGTIPRGPLETGRGSRSLKPGESQIVGSESVRLRASLLARRVDDDGTGLDYAIEDEAGAGGMGVVYKARQQSLDRLVAIKQIKSDKGVSTSDSNKFVSEAVITGQLEHPNVIPVHDLGLAADGMPFYAMKFVEGDEWEDRIKELSEEENLSILIQVAQAIAFAHSKEVLHRDLKPGNIMLGKFGEVLVMDWGLAARLDDNSHIQPAGTPIYMPPETALEYLDYAKGRVVGGRKKDSSRKRMPAGKYSDIYLLGALLFKVVARRAPHRGKSTFECLRNAAKNEIVKVRRSSELLDIAYKAMATDPEDRYPTAIDFIDALKAYQSHAQSIQIAKTASRELRRAEKLRTEDNADATEIYACFSRAQHGYQNALDLWSENRKAARRRKKTLRLFAEAAYGNGDYDLALSMLDVDSDEDAELRATVLKDQQSRNSRLAWFKTLQYATAASLMIALAFIAYSFVARQDALTARAQAKAAQAEALDAEDRAKEQTAKAAEAEVRAAEAEKTAIAKAEQARLEGIKVQELSAEAAKLARKAELASDEARKQQQIAARASTLAKKQSELADEKAREAAKQRVLVDLATVRTAVADGGAYAGWVALQSVES
ncbi:MAG: protein kinase, partial [Planctomycetota bacterium]